MLPKCWRIWILVWLITWTWTCRVFPIWGKIWVVELMSVVARVVRYQTITITIHWCNIPFVLITIWWMFNYRFMSPPWKCLDIGGSTCVSWFDESLCRTSIPSMIMGNPHCDKAHANHSHLHRHHHSGG